MKRLLFYRSCGGGHQTLGPELRQLGVEHYELPRRYGLPRIDAQHIELGVHYTQPFDLTKMGVTPTWEQARDRTLWEQGAAARAVGAALRRGKCLDDRYLHHHEWASAHRKNIGRVYLVSGDAVPKDAVERLGHEFPTSVEFVASSLDVYKRGHGGRAPELAEQDQWALAANLADRIQHAASTRDVIRALELARQLALRLRANDAEADAELVEAARLAADPLAALQSIPRPSAPRRDEALADLAQLPEPFSIHVFSSVGLGPEITAVLPDWVITWDRHEQAARNTIVVDRQQVFIVDRHPGAEDLGRLQSLVAQARDQGSVTVSWSDRPATAIDVHVEWHHDDARTPARFIELLRRIADHHPQIRNT